MDRSKKHEAQPATLTMTSRAEKTQCLAQEDPRLYRAMDSHKRELAPLSTTGSPAPRYLSMNKIRVEEGDKYAARFVQSYIDPLDGLPAYVVFEREIAASIREKIPDLDDYSWAVTSFGKGAGNQYVILEQVINIDPRRIVAAIRRVRKTHTEPTPEAIKEVWAVYATVTAAGGRDLLALPGSGVNVLNLFGPELEDPNAYEERKGARKTITLDDETADDDARFRAELQVFNPSPDKPTDNTKKRADEIRARGRRPGKTKSGIEFVRQYLTGERRVDGLAYFVALHPDDESWIDACLSSALLKDESGPVRWRLIKGGAVTIESKRTIRLARLIYELNYVPLSRNEFVRTINRNPLDMRKENLEAVPRSEILRAAGVIANDEPES